MEIQICRVFGGENDFNESVHTRQLCTHGFGLKMSSFRCLSLYNEIFQLNLIFEPWKYCGGRNRIEEGVEDRGSNRGCGYNREIAPAVCNLFLCLLGN